MADTVASVSHRLGVLYAKLGVSGRRDLSTVLGVDGTSAEGCYRLKGKNKEVARR